ncbi:MAG: UTP--glucose-1-phosphate uridylyltransferase GalU [Desulfovibrionaceae bacterium]
MDIQSITKVIIPVAGWGTRSLPASKNIPKEMLPVHDKPTVQYIVEEAVASHIRDIIFITSKDKKIIEDHFDYSPQLEDLLLRTGKIDLLKKVQAIAEYVNIISVRQKKQKGLGHAILCAKDVIGNEAFAVMLGDDLFFSEEPGIGQIMHVAKTYNKPVIGFVEVEEEDVSKYGIIECSKIKDSIFTVENVLEKPQYTETKSRKAIVGRYILTPEIFTHLENTKAGKFDEIQLTDALSTMLKETEFLAVQIQGRRFDAGDRIDYLLANIHFALKDSDVSAKLRSSLIKMLDSFE